MTEGTNQKRITRSELVAMAKKRGMEGYWNLELAERLGIELPKPMRNEERKPREEERKPRKARRV